jgi:hypothetical protein
MGYRAKLDRIARSTNKNCHPERSEGPAVACLCLSFRSEAEESASSFACSCRCLFLLVILSEAKNPHILPLPLPVLVLPEGSWSFSHGPLSPRTLNLEPVFPVNPLVAPKSS